MKLTDEDYMAIAAQIESGTNNIEYEKDGELLSIECEYETDGYVEDDYYNGTGAFVETSRDLTIRHAQCLDSEGDPVDCEVDAFLLERMVV